jgi:hypothetical protein
MVTNNPDPDTPTTIELARRLLEHAPSDMSVDLVVAALPSGYAEDVPMPSGARLLGSLLRSRRGRPMHLEAVFDAPGDPTSVVDAYRKQLHNHGWDLFEGLSGPMHGGFIPGAAGDDVMLRRGGRGPVLMVAALARQGGPVDLRARLDWEMPRHLGDWRPVRQRGFDRMPALRAPSGTELQPHGAGGGGGRWHSEATIDTDRPIGELEEHFASQLANSGWKRLDGRSDETIGWSSWQLPGEGGWRGLFLVLAPFGTRERSLWLSIAASEQDDDDRGFESYSVAAGH